MKLEVGMYVRTVKGIAKIIKIFANGDEPYDNVKYETDRYLDIYFDSQYVSEEDILKEPSFNIIDLIEVGDYVNGKKVIDKWEEPDWYGYFIKLDGEEIIPTIRNIKSVITHEQMEQMAYKVGE